MARKPLLISLAIVALVGIGVVSAALLASIALLPAALIGLLSAGLVLAGQQLVETSKKNMALKESMDELQSQFVYLHERQGQADAKLHDMVKRTIDSPSLALHATATDIDVLGTLVSDLARTVSEHDGKLMEQAKSLQNLSNQGAFKASAKPMAVVAPPFQPFAAQTMRPAVPQSFEKEAELGFTADFPVAAKTLKSEARPTSPAVMSELRETLAKAIADNRLELSLQPIVVLPQRKARGYEATMSLKGVKLGDHNAPDLPKIAAATGLRVELDRALLARAVHVSRILRTRQREIAVTCAIALESLADQSFRKQIDDLVRNDEKMARSILLEVDDADIKASGVAGKTNLIAVSQLGIGIGLSLTESLRFHAPDLVNLGVRQLRVSAALMQSAAQGSAAADIHPADVAELLQRNSIDLLVCDISDEDTVRDMLDYSAQFAQGDLFGISRVVRPEVLEPKSVAGSVAGTNRQHEAPLTGAERTAAAANSGPRNIPRQSFRSLLRKA